MIDGMAIGVRRLSIIDVAGGHQPFVAEDGRLALVGNGEIYNHERLRDDLRRRGHRFTSGSDMETVLHLYEERGLGSFDELRGMFAIAIADGRTGQLVLVRDRLGIKPLYYSAASGGRLGFASEYRVLRDLPWVTGEPDLEGLRQFAAWGWIAPPGTALTGVRKLGPGQLLVAGDGDLRVETWWERPAPERGRGSVSEAELFELLDGTVADHLMSEVPLGLFLSGGLDSSMVAALAARHHQGLSSFTVHFAGQADQSDRQAARQVAAHLGLDHRELEIDTAPNKVLEDVAAHHDEPVGDAACIPTYLMSQAARDHVTVILTGEGGDEAFAGYRKYRHLQMARAVRLLPGPLRDGAIALGGRGSDERRRAKLEAWLGSPLPLSGLRYDEVFTRSERARLFADGGGEISEPVPPPGLGAVESSLWIDSGWPLSEQLNMKLDKMSMAHSLESRVPFLDHVVVETAARLSARDRRAKTILRRIAAGLLPAEVWRRRKHGFTVPVADWLRGELRATAAELLAPDRLRAQGLWRPEQVGRWLAQHLDGRVDRGRQIWNLLAVQLWFDQVAR